MLKKLFNNRRKGFTLAELLIVVGILAVLLAVSIPGIIYYRKNLHQKELDEKAQIIYVAAQNQISILEADGYQDKYDPEIEITSDGRKIKELSIKPSDATFLSADPAAEFPDLYFVTREDYSRLANPATDYSDSDKETTAFAFMGSTSLDGNTDDVLSNNYWVIEYAPASGTIYAVFYAETDDRLTDYAGNLSYYDGLRGTDRKPRIDDGAKVGYYGGDANAGDFTIKLMPSITIINEEILYAELRCYTKPGIEIIYEVTLEDEEGNKYIESNIAPTKMDTLNTAILTLDDLTSESTRFNKLYGLESGHGDGKCLTPGEDITITVKASIKDDAKLGSSTVASATTNSLFADEDHYVQVFDGVYFTDEIKGKNNIAVIQYVRHLQNLDATSGIEDVANPSYQITKAIQINELDFESEYDSKDKLDSATKHFFTTYTDVHHGDSDTFSFANHLFTTGGSRTSTHDGTTQYFNGTITKDTKSVPDFKPINNKHLTEYTGAYPKKDKTYNNYHTLKNMTIITGAEAVNSLASVKGAESAGLFDSINGHDLKVKGLDLIDTTIHASNNGASAGALVGTVQASNVNIENVRIYLSTEGRKDKTNKDVWIKGTNAGGMIGSISGGMIDTAFSCAATVVGDDKTKSAGGLVGAMTGGSINIKNSYADNYLFAEKIGGLIGESTGVVSIEKSYAAGYADGFSLATYTENTEPAKYMAGLVGGSINKCSNSYTILTYLINEEDKDKDLTYYTYSTAKTGANFSSVYYLIASTDSKKDITGSISIGTLLKKDDLLNGLGSAFIKDTSDTEAYNLMDQGLTTYPYPRIAEPVKGAEWEETKHYMSHKNDWVEEFRAGSLVYYEWYGCTDEELEEYIRECELAGTECSLDAQKARVYQKYSEGYDGIEAGFYGGSISALEKDINVIGDGYGIAYLATEDIPDKVEVEITAKDALTGIEKTFKQTLDLKDYSTYSGIPPFKTTKTVSIAGRLQQATFVIYPISEEIINNSFASAEYYQKASVTAVADVSQNPGDGTDAATSPTDYYYFNPQFAKTVLPMQDGTAEAPLMTEATPVYIRTARNLYNMSLYYDVYRNATKNTAFIQEENVDYYFYDWHYFYRDMGEPTTGTPVAEYKSEIKKQKPIGDGKSPAPVSFTSIYEGGFNEIRNISFETSEKCTSSGLFVANDGIIMNLYLPADYTEGSDKNHYSTINKNIGQNVDAYMGTIAGINNSKGIISNCASAGFTLGGTSGTISAYNDSNLHVGGLVGRNAGHIANCSADSPLIKLNMNFSTDFIGAFTGENTGYINNCYALSVIEIMSTRGGSVNVGGFAGYNSGIIGYSYCATAMKSSGDTTEAYGFTSQNGSVYSCHYLDRGTFTYVKNSYSYNADPDITSGDSALYKDMVKYAEGSKTTKELSKYHINTASSDGIYPYRAVVKNEKGELVHYGEWQDDVVMGSLGILYWEKETSGSNNGYHYTYLGTVEGAGGKLTYSKGTSLCVAHDDKGVITDYGYGFYVRKDLDTNISLQTDGIAISAFNGGTEFTVNSEAKDMLETQMVNYSVFPFTTKTDESGDYIYLSEQNCEGNGRLSLTFKGTDDINVTYNYTISPFFANAMSFDSYKKGDNATVSVTDKIEVTASDYTKTDYNKRPGFSSDNKYEIRSAQQLQYLNWNYESKSTDKLVDGSNYRHFTYLTQASITGAGEQKWEDAYNHDIRHYNQTHDLNADSISNFTPIAGSNVGKRDYGYDITLYAWFGGDYDGQNYKIKNISINSPSYTVGLFGATAGVDIKNIVMYSDNDSVIQRNTAGPGDHDGSYVVGGMIGVAYDYKQTATEHAVSNCTIAGYRVCDNSKSVQSTGEANVGGLIGAANLKLRQCASVVDIEINCRHVNADGTGAHAFWGDYLRCGGLTGANKARVSDCYTGGSISVARDTLDETFDDNNIPLDPTTSDRINQYNNLHIYIGGISGSAFTCTYKNFENVSSHHDGDAAFDNCYTYINLPRMEGNIRSVSVIGGLADRFAQGHTIEYRNCYYLDSVVNDFEIKMPNYHFYGNDNKDHPVLTNALMDGTLADGKTRKMHMLMGDLVYMKDYYWDSHHGTPVHVYNGLTALTYDQMNSRLGLLPGNEIQPVANPLTGTMVGTSYTDFAAALNGGRGIWGYVSITEGNNVSINGKYSFPGNASALDGKNYPFATVIKQKDIVYSTADNAKYVNVHYGRWPFDASYWTNARASMDIFDDLVIHTGVSASTHGAIDVGFAEKTFVFKDTKRVLADKDEFKNNLVFSVSDIVSIVNVDDSQGPGIYAVTLRALKDGALTITESKTGASFDLNVTAKLPVSYTPPEVKYYQYKNDGVTPQDTPVKVEFNAGTGALDLSKMLNIKWGISAADPADDAYLDIKLAIDNGNPDPRPTDNFYANISTTRFEADGSEWRIDLTLSATYSYPYIEDDSTNHTVNMDIDNDGVEETYTVKEYTFTKTGLKFISNPGNEP